MSPTAAKPKRSKTAAEVELDQRSAEQRTGDKALKEQATEQRKEQKEELAAGKRFPSGDRSVLKGSPAQQRTRNPDAKPVGGTVDNMTARDGSDPLVGHMVTIDYSSKKVRDLVKAQLGDHVDPDTHVADYGSLLDVAEVGDDGYPVSGRVFLRDEHAAIIVVPWDALRRSAAGGRR